MKPREFISSGPTGFSTPYGSTDSTSEKSVLLGKRNSTKLRMNMAALLLGTVFEQVDEAGWARPLPHKHRRGGSQRQDWVQGRLGLGLRPLGPAQPGLASYC